MEYKKIIENACKGSILHLELLRLKIKQGCHPDEHRDLHGNTPLYWTLDNLASIHKPTMRQLFIHYEVLSILLEGGTNVNQITHYRQSILIVYTVENISSDILFHPKFNILKLFKKYGAHFDPYILFPIVSQWNLAVTKWLLDQGLDVNVRNKYKYTPLLIAAMNKQTKQVKLLLKRGANPFCSNSHGSTLFSFCEKEKAKSILKKYFQERIFLLDLFFPNDISVFFFKFLSDIRIEPWLLSGSKQLSKPS